MLDFRRQNEFEEICMPTNVAVAEGSRGNWGMLGALWVVYGVIRFVVVAVMVVYSGTATVMFGALLNRVPDPMTLMNLFHIFYTVGIVVAGLSGLFAILAGLSMLAGKSAARGLGLVASLLSVSDVPLGTTLGTYTMIRVLT
jgi:hypothetical protein